MTNQPPDNQQASNTSAQSVDTRYYYPNRLGRILLLALEDVVGQDAMRAVLKLAGYEQFASLLPPSNNDRSFGFEIVSRLNQVLEDMYGPRAARQMAIRIGRTCFHNGLRDFGPMRSIGELTFQLLPLNLKLERGTQALADMLNDFTDQIVRVEDVGDVIYWYTERCAVCWGRQSEEPVCHLMVGWLHELLSWVSGGKAFQIEEQLCIARGDNMCKIAILKTPLE